MEALTGKVLSACVGFRLWLGSVSLDTSVSTFLESLDASDVLTAIIHFYLPCVPIESE